MATFGVSRTVLRESVNQELRDDGRFELLRGQARRKNYISIGLYALSVPAAFLHPAITMVLAFTVAGIYFLPETLLDKRERG